VRVDEEVTDRRLAQQLVDARHIATLAEPHALRAAAEMLLVQVCRGVHLRAHRGPVAIHQREVRVRGGSRDHLDVPGVLELAQGEHEVALVAAPGVPHLAEAVAIHLGQALVVRLVLGAANLFLGERDQIIEVLGIARLEQVIREHAQERRRHRHRAAVGDAIGREPLEHLD
jgi:hypothetical protein